MSAMRTKAKIICRKCGAEMAVNRVYCDECGEQLEHDIQEVQASVDNENRLEKVRSYSKTIRWFLAASLVLTIGGCYFRKAYRELPTNDIVAFATAPTVAVSAESSVETTDFVVPLPEPKEPAKPARVEEGDIDLQLIEAGLKDVLVNVRKRGSRAPIQVVPIGDIVFFLPVPGRPDPVPVHLAEVRRIRPLGQNRWEITARTLKEPAQITIANPAKVHIKVLERRPDGKEVVQTIPLDQIQELKPL